MSGDDGIIIIFVSVLPSLLIAVPIGAILWFKMPKEQQKFQFHPSEIILMLAIFGISLLPFWINIIGMLYVILAPLTILGSVLGWLFSRFRSKLSLPSSGVSIPFMILGSISFPVVGAFACIVFV